MVLTLKYNLHMVFRLVILVQFIVLTTLLHSQSFSDYKVVGNTTGVTELTQAQVKSYFKAKYTLWGNGKSVKVVLHSSESTQAEKLAKLVYNTSHQGVKKYWLSLVFQGRANPPVYFDSDSEVLEYVKKTPGAIGIVQKATSCPSQYIIQIK
jgi:ABC-type phosphate transport system substrate-binding protein